MNELELITLRVSPEEARMLATACAVRSLSRDFYSPDGAVPRLYRDLAAKVDRQRSLGNPFARVRSGARL